MQCLSWQNHVLASISGIMNYNFRPNIEPGRVLKGSKAAQDDMRAPTKNAVVTLHLSTSVAPMNNLGETIKATVCKPMGCVEITDIN